MRFKQKYLRAFVRYLLVAVAMISGTALAAPGATIPDDNLRVVLEQELGKGEGAPITEAELAGLTRLVATEKSITDLTGLEHRTIYLQHSPLPQNRA